MICYECVIEVTQKPMQAARVILMQAKGAREDWSRHWLPSKLHVPQIGEFQIVAATLYAVHERLSWTGPVFFRVSDSFFGSFVFV